MWNRIGVLFVCLLLPDAAFAGTIVTWVADGEITRNYQQNPFQSVPPIGTRFSLSMTFDPTSAIPTPNAPPPWNDGRCQRVGVSASFNLGGYIYSGSNNLAFTNAALPGTNCTGSELTQFSLHNVATPPDSPWSLGGGVLILSYRDLLVQDAFPLEPTTQFASLWWDSFFEGKGFGGSSSNLRALDQPTAVPEPGTMMLLATGLAAAWRARRRHDSV